MEQSAEPVAATTTEITTSEAYEPPSFNEMLSGKSKEAEAPVEEPAMEVAPEPEPVVATPAPVAPPVESAPVTQAPPTIPPDLLRAEVQKATQGLIGALQAERLKRQEYESQVTGSMPVDEATAQYTALKRQMLQQSERMARIAYKDYDQVVALTHAECANNPALTESILSAEVPAEAAYQAGLNFKAMQEFGPEVIGNPYALAEKVRAKVEAETRLAMTKEFEARLSTKGTERSKTPTDIGAARAAGGGAVPYVSPTFAEMLASATKR